MAEYDALVAIGILGGVDAHTFHLGNPFVAVLARASGWAFGCTEQIIEMQERLRVYDGISGRLVLDVSAEELEWPDGSECILTVSDALHLMHMDQEYSDLCKVQPVACNAMADCEELAWGSAYQLLRRRCPRCTMCESCCVRGPEQHVLCIHDNLRAPVA